LLIHDLNEYTGNVEVSIDYPININNNLKFKLLDI